MFDIKNGMNYHNLIKLQGIQFIELNLRSYQAVGVIFSIWQSCTLEIQRRHIRIIENKIFANGFFQFQMHYNIKLLFSGKNPEYTSQRPCKKDVTGRNNHWILSFCKDSEAISPPFLYRSGEEKVIFKTNLTNFLKFLKHFLRLATEQWIQPQTEIHFATTYVVNLRLDLNKMQMIFFVNLSYSFF